MKIPQEINTYCKKCQKHTKHRVKKVHSGKDRGQAEGNRRHARRIKGYTAKVGGMADPVKQSEKRRVIVECEECGHKQEKHYKRSRKKIEIER